MEIKRTNYKKILHGVSKGESEEALEILKPLLRFPIWPSGESEDHTEGPRLLLCLLSCQHKKVRPPAGTGSNFFLRVYPYTEGFYMTH